MPEVIYILIGLGVFGVILSLLAIAQIFAVFFSVTDIVNAAKNNRIKKQYHKR